MKIHIWRYESLLPKSSEPWILSVEGTQEPVSFETWEDARDVADIFVTNAMCDPDYDLWSAVAAWESIKDEKENTIPVRMEDGSIMHVSTRSA